MPLEEVRRALRSAERNVLVEAPAGCGKTFEAAELAAELGNSLSPGAEVLLLAHTNAAVQEFVRRTRASGARVRATTIDAFCLDLLTPYAARLNLPTPLRRAVGLVGSGVPFHELAPAAASLLMRCPSIATAMAYRHPIVILDEHQDASVAQHEIAAALNRSEHCRVRVFADRMQAIYEQADGTRISWDRLSREADTFVELDDPRRWGENGELGGWILSARRELAAGRPLPMTQRPASVRVTRADWIECANFGYGNAGQLAVPINRFLNDHDGTAVVLARSRNLVWTLHEAARHRLLFNEGADYQDAYALVAAAAMNNGNGQRLALLLVDHLRDV
jgi:DNA helicase-2/ATP-dependent DNA helicase PcrA